MARRQYKRSPHPGVVLTPRRYATGETTWRARYVDPDTGVKVWEKLEHTLSNHEARRVWAIRKAEALSQRRAELKTGARRRTRTPFDDALKDFWTSCRAQLRASTIATYGHGIRHSALIRVSEPLPRGHELAVPHAAALRRPAYRQGCARHSGWELSVWRHIRSPTSFRHRC